MYEENPNKERLAILVACIDLKQIKQGIVAVYKEEPENGVLLILMLLKGFNLDQLWKTLKAHKPRRRGGT